MAEIQIVTILWLANVDLKLPWGGKRGFEEDDRGKQLTWDGVGSLGITWIEAFSKEIQSFSKQIGLQLSQVVLGVLGKVIAIRGEDESGSRLGGYPLGSQQCGFFPCEFEMKLRPE